MISCQRLFLVVMAIAFSIDSAFSMPGKEDENLEETEALKEKWGTVFEFMDSNNDGIFTEEDIYALASRLVQYSRASEDQVDGIMQFWHLYKDGIDAYFGVDSKKNGLTKSEWVELLGWYWTTDFEVMEQRINMFYTTVFHAIDKDNDGVVDFKEFTPYYKQFGRNNAVNKKAEEAFKLIDADSDKHITEDEFRDVYARQYYLDPKITVEELPVF